MKKLHLMTLAAVLALAGAACSGGDDGGAIASPTATGDAIVQGTAANLFDPAAVTIAAGETVAWNWTGSHNVVSKAGSTELDSGEITASGSYTHTFETAGTYDYFCEAHGDAMSGTVTVT